MVSAMDDERWAAEMLRQEALDDCDQILADLDRRRLDLDAAGGPASEWTPPAPAPIQPQQRRTRAVEPRQSQPQQPLIDWEKTALWVQQHIDQRVGTRTREYVHDIVVALGEEAGKLCGELKAQIERQAEKIAALEARLDAEIRAAQDARIAALETRLAEAEARAAAAPTPLRLVGTTNDAAG